MALNFLFCPSSLLTHGLIINSDNEGEIKKEIIWTVSPRMNEETGTIFTAKPKLLKRVSRQSISQVPYFKITVLGDFIFYILQTIYHIFACNCQGVK